MLNNSDEARSVESSPAAAECLVWVTRPSLTNAGGMKGEGCPFLPHLPTLGT